MTALPSGVGASADIGRRSHMEDRWAVQATPGGLFAAVYDGHGGSRVADRAGPAADLLDAIMHRGHRLLRRLLDRTDQIRDFAGDGLFTARTEDATTSRIASGGMVSIVSVTVLMTRSHQPPK